MNFIDTHAHLYKEYYPDNLEEVIQRSINANVTEVILPCVNAGSMPDILEATSLYPKNLFPLVGLHPIDVKANYKAELAQLENFLSHSSIVGIGEVGIDLYRDKSYMNEQKDAFYQQLIWASELDLPLSIHIRDGYEVAFDILKQFQHRQLRGILHCFSGGIQEARWAVKHGFKLGIGGVVTFKRNKLEAIIKEIGLKHIVLETDAPFLAPDPYRGKQNESSYIPIIATKIATIFETSVEKVRDMTTENAHLIFNKIEQ